MSSVFSFMREPIEPSDGREDTTPNEPRLLETSNEERVAPDIPLPASASASSAIATPSAALTAMLTCLQAYLPTNSDGLPHNLVSVAKLNERPIGLGNFRGEERVDNFMLVALKGGRLEATVRYQLWAETVAEAEALGVTLQGAILADKDTLRGDGFLRMALLDSSTAELNVPLNASTKSVEFTVLYEYTYQDTDGAESLIAAIPVHSDPEELNSPNRESFTVTDGMTRWDEESAPLLRIRGSQSIQHFALLMYQPGPMPTAPIRLRRTFDGATGPEATFVSFDAFLNALTAPLPARHAEWTFASLTDFVALFTPTGESIELGDREEDLSPDSYELRHWSLTTAIPLPNSNDRFEIAYAPAEVEPKFDQSAVFYLRNQEIL